MNNISIEENKDFVIMSSSKIEMDRTISFLFADKKIDFPVKISADFKNLNPKFHEMALSIMNSQFAGINVHNGHFTSGGKDVTPHLNKTKTQKQKLGFWRKLKENFLNL